MLITAESGMPEETERKSVSEKEEKLEEKAKELI